jgi:hypothetical protein
MSAVKAALSEAQRGAQLSKGTGAAMNAHPENSWFQRQTLPKKSIPTMEDKNTELLMVEGPAYTIVVQWVSAVVMGTGAVIAVVNERCSSVRERCNDCISIHHFPPPFVLHRTGVSSYSFPESLVKKGSGPDRSAPKLLHELT